MPALAAMAVADGATSFKRTITGDMPRLMQKGLSLSGFDMDLVNFFQIVRAKGVGTMLVTVGIDGSYLADASGIHFCPSLRVEVKGTAGAGDAFISTLSALLASGVPVDAAMPSAAVNAAGVASEVDTQSGLMQKQALATRVAETTDQLPVTFWPWSIFGLPDQTT